MEQFVDRLDQDEHEFFLLGWGQSNLRPWGDRDDGFAELPHLQLAEAGMDITITQMVASDGTHGLAGTTSILTVSQLLVPHAWVTCEVRLVAREYTDSGELAGRRGVGFVIANDETSLTVTWLTGINGTSDSTIYTSLAGSVRRLLTSGAFSYYQNVRCLVPYQPEDADAYPAGNLVPGYSFPSTITSNEDSALLLPWCWNEGVDGIGFRTSTTTFSGGSKLTITVPNYLISEDDILNGAIVRVIHAGSGVVAQGTVTDCDATADTLTVDAWTGAAATNLALIANNDTIEVNVPHWRDNPHPIGYRYPANDMQPGGWISAAELTPGSIYNRAAGRLEPSYVRASLADASINPATCSTGIAQRVASAAGSMTPSIATITTTTNGDTDIAGVVITDVGHPFKNGNIVTVSSSGAYGSPLAPATPYYVKNATANTFEIAATPTGASISITDQGGVTYTWTTLRLRITSNATINTTGETPFTEFLVPGYLVALSGFAGSPSINGTWRVNTLTPGTGDVIDLVGYDTTSVPSSIGTAAGATGAKVTRRTFVRDFTFGPVLPWAWKLSAEMGVRVNVVHLGINASSLLPGRTPISTGWPARIGWWHPDLAIDWHPASPNALFARLVRMATVMAPAALLAEGSTKTARFLAIYGQQGESEATVTEGRDRYQQLLYGFLTKLRAALEPWSPYRSPVQIPWAHPELPAVPWESSLLPNGDTQGVLNTGIRTLVAVDGWGCTWDTDARGKIADLIHFNGRAAAQNGTEAATRLLPLIGLGLSQGEDSEAVTICNLALSHIGESSITSLYPPDTGSVTASLCKQYYQQTRDQLLEAYNWSFASRRATLVELTNSRTETDHVYALPTDCLKVLSVLPSYPSGYYGLTPAGGSVHTIALNRVDSSAIGVPDFFVERDTNGMQILRCDVAQADVLYQARVSDVSQFPPTFKDVLAWLLAARLAGAVIRGAKGAEMAQTCMRNAYALMQQAAQFDAQQHRVTQPMQHVPEWLRLR